MSPASKEVARSTLEKWMKEVGIEQLANYKAASHYNERNRGFGLIVTSFSVLVGTSIFAGLNSTSFGAVAIFAGIVSAITAVLSGAQAFLNYSELAAKTRSVGLKLGDLKLDLEEELASSKSGDELEKSLDKIKKRWDLIESEAPTIPQKFYDQASEHKGQRQMK